MKSTKVILATLTAILLIGFIGAEITASPLKKLINRNNKVISEVYEPATTRSLAVTRLGQSGINQQSLADKLAGTGVVTSNIQFTGRNLAGGVFSGGTSAGFGFANGVILSSGAASNAIGPNTTASKSTNNQQPGDADLDILAGDTTYDAAVLEFDFVPQYDKISLNYILASEEYPEMIDYADVMAIYVDGVNIALIPGTPTPVSITTINQLLNTQYYVDNLPVDNNYGQPYTAPYDTQADGFTVSMTATASLTAGQMHHIKIAVADLGDNVYDTWLMLQEDSFYSAADLAIELDAPINPVQGTIAQYHLQASNLGIVNAANTVVNFRLPLGSTLQGLPAGVSAGAGTYTWTIGSLAAGANQGLSLNCLMEVVPPGVAIAEISSGTLDRDSSNNRSLPYTNPLGANDSYATAEDTSLNVGTLNGVLINDEVYSLNAPSVEVVSNCTHGNLNLNPSGAFIYTPALNYYGTDGFSYRIYDGINYSPATSVQINITPVNDPPVMSAIPNLTMVEDSSTQFNLASYASDVDGDPLTLTVSGFDNGTWSANGLTLTMQGNLNWYGLDGITITLSDGVLTASRNLNMTVTAVPDISTNPATLAFGNVMVGGLNTIRLYIHNSGNSVATLQAPYFTSSNAAFSFSAPSATGINPGGSVYTDVTFAPTQSIGYSGTLGVINSVFGESPYNVSMSGTALTFPAIAVNPVQITATYASGSSHQDNISISNTGQVTLNWSAVMGTGSPSWMSIAPLSGNIAGGANAPLTLSCNLSGVAAGSYSGSIVITSNAQNTPVLNIPVSITVTGIPQISIPESSVDFGSKYTGINHSYSLVVNNTGTATLQLTAAIDPPFGVSPSTLSIPAFQSGTLNISLYSTSGGQVSHNLVINSNSGTNAHLELPVAANLIVPPTLVPSSYEIQAFTIAETGTTKSLRISNTGSQPLTWQSNVQYQDSESDWLGLYPAFGTIPAGGQQIVSLSFSPAFLNSGMYSALLLLGSNDPLHPNVPIAVSYCKQDYYATFYDNNNNANTDLPDGDMGTNITHNSPLNPIEFNIYSHMPEISSARLVIRAEDVGENLGENCAVSINGYALGILRGHEGEESTSIFNVNPLYLVNQGKNLVQIAVDTNEQGDGITVHNAQLVINNMVLDAQIRYIQTDQNSYIAGETITANIEIDTQLSNQALVVETALQTLSGEDIVSVSRSLSINAMANDAFAENLLIPQGLADGTYRITVAVYDQSTMLQQDMMSLDIVLLPNQARISTSANELDFGIVPAGLTGTQQLYITNVGNLPLNISGFTGQNPGLDANPATASINPGVSQLFAVHMQSGTPGSYGNTLLINSNDPDNPVTPVSVVANIIPNEPYISVNPGYLEFGECFTGQNKEQVLTVSNLGPVDLQVSTLEFGNPAFHANTASFTLGYNQTCQISIAFSTPTPGENNTTLTINSNATNAPHLGIPIYATAVLPPQLSLSPQAINATIASGTTAAPELLIGNNGGSQLRWGLSENMGKAVHFGGYEAPSPEFGIISNRSNIQLATGSFTVSLWAKSESNTGGHANGGSTTGGKQYLLSKSTEGYAGFFGLYLEGVDDATHDQDLVLTLRNAQGMKELRATGVITLDQWFHVAATYESGTMRLFLNGEQVASQAVAGFVGNTGSWVLGKYGTEAGRYYRFQGSLDELRIFDVAKNAQYLKQTMYGRLSSLEPYLCGYWKFDAGNLNDATSSNNHGTLQGSATFPASDVTSVAPWISCSPAHGDEPANSAQSVSINLSALGKMAGQYTDSIELRCNDLSTPVLTIPVVMNVTGAAAMELDPSSLSFGDVIIGQPANIQLNISNNGTAALNLTNILVSQPVFSCGLQNLSIPPQSSQILNVGFLPPNEGSFSGFLRFDTNISGMAHLDVPLSGNGALPPVLSYDPASFSQNMSFGNVANRTLNISNSQGMALNYNLSLQDNTRSNASGEYHNLTSQCTGMTWLNGYLYFLGFSSNLLGKYDPETESIVQTWPIHSSPYGIATDGNVLFVGSATGRIYRYSSAGVQLSSFTNPLITFTPTIIFQSNALYISNSNIAHAAIYKLNLSGTLLATYTSNLARNTQVVYVREHSPAPYYALQPSLGRIVRFSLDAQTAVPVDTLLVSMGNAYALAHNGRDFYLLENAKDYMTRIDDGQSEFNWITLGNVSGNVVAGNTANVSLSLSSRNTFAGTYHANLVLGTNDPLHPSQTIPITMNVTGQPALAYDPTSIDYGVCYLGYPFTREIHLENNGSAPLTLTGINTLAPFSCSLSTLTIQPWQSYDLAVVYTPTALGQDNGTLGFDTNDPGHPQINISLAGNCTEAPHIVVNPTQISQALMSDQNTTIQVQVQNTGITPLSFTLGTNANSRATENQSTIANPPALSTKNGGEEKLTGQQLDQYPILLQNAGAVSVNDTLYVVSFNTNELVAQTLSPLQETARYAIHSHPYGIAWDGTAFWIGGQGGTLYRYLKSGLQSTGLNQPVAHLNTDIGNLPAFTVDNGDIIVANAFSGNAPTTFRRYRNNVLLAEYYSTIKNVGQLSSIPNYGPGNIWAYQNLLTTEGVPNGGNLLRIGLSSNQVTPLASYSVWDNQLTYTLAHDGNDLLISDIDGPLLRIDDGFWLGSTLQGTTLAAGSAVNVPVKLDPAGGDGGNYSGQVMFMSNDPAHPQLVLPVSLVVTGYSRISANPVAAVIDTTLIGTHKNRTITLSNSGNDVLVISAITSSNPAFTSNPSQLTIPAHSSRSIIITFTPTSEGEQTADILIASNAVDSPQLHLSLSAFGLLPRANIVVQPTPYDFGGVYTNSSAVHTFTVRNTGTAALVITALQSTSGAFGTSHVLPMVVPIGSQASLDIVFSPAVAGPYQETLNIISNSDPNPQYGIVLSGTGLPPLAHISVTPVPLSFGTVIVTVPSSLMMHVSNTGQLPLNITQISSDLPALSSSVNNLVIPVGQGEDVQLTLTATTPGQLAGNLLLASNDPDHPLLSIPINALAILGNPAIQVSPSSLSFGSVVIGSTSNKILTVRNTGNLPLVLNSISSSQPAYSVSQSSATLAPLQSLDLTVTYTPTNPMVQNAILLIQNNSPANPSLQVSLSGQGQHPVYYSLNPEIIDEYTNTAGVITRNLVITNTSPGNLSFQIAKTNPNATWLSVNPSSGSVTPGNNATLQVSLNTTGLNFDLYETQLKVTSNSQSAPERFIPVYLNYSNYNITTNDNEDNQGSGSPDGDMDVPIVYNNPLAPVEFNIFTDATTVNQAQLRIVHQNVRPGESSRVFLNNQLLGTLASASGTTQESHFNIPPSYLSLGLTQTNTVRINVDEAHQNPSGSTILLGQLDYNKVFQNASIVSLTTQPTVITPDTLLTILETVTTNLFAQTVRIETKLYNASDQQQLNTISRVVNLSAYQNSNSSATWNLANQVPAGAYHVMVSVYDANSNQLQTTQRLDFMIRPDTPTISLNSPSLAFGTVYAGYPSTRELVINNLGAATLQISNLHFSNVNFSSPVSTITIAPSSSYSLPVTVNLATLGAVNANLTITSNDPLAPITLVSLEATVVNPPHISANPASLALTMLQYDTAQRQIQITNTGLSILHLEQPYLENLSWAQLSNLALTLNPGQSTTLTVSFNSTGIEQGMFPGTLFIPSDDPEHPLLSVPITVDITPQPLIAEFNASPISGQAPLNVHFTSQAYTTDGSNLTDWEWDFDNNGIVDSSLPNPTHLYTSAGSYTVSLRVFSDSRAQHQVVKSNYIFVINNDPVVSAVIPEITMLEDSVMDSLNLANYFSDPDNDPLVYSVSPNPNLTFGVANSILRITPLENYNGTESIEITASDNHGSSISQTVLVHVIAVNDGPMFHDLPAEFTYLRRTSLRVDLAQYIQDADTDPTLITVSVSGNVNTTCTVNGQRLTFASVGNWFGTEQVTITIDDNSTRTTASANVTLNVLESLVASFYADPTDVYAGIPVQFTNTVPGNPTNYEWDFENDGIVDNTDPNPHHTYDLGGWYSVRLRVLCIEGADTLHVAETVRTDYIHVTGTHVPGGDLLSDWVLAGSPYNITGPVVIPTTSHLTWSPNVNVNILNPDVFIKVEGSLQASDIDITTYGASATHWQGFRVEPGAGTVSISNSTIHNAETPFILRSDATIQNCSIAKDSLLTFTDEWAVRIADAGNPSLDGIEINNYSNGLLITSPVMASQPTLSNIRIRNSSNSVRTDTYGLKVLDNASPLISGMQIEDFTFGAYYEGTGQTLAAPVLISNIRVRNSSNSIRSNTTGIWVKDLQAVQISADSLGNCLAGVRVENTLPAMAAHATISNIRIRNSSNSVRTPSQGITIEGNVRPVISDVDLDDYVNGVVLSGTNTTYANQPLISNIRVRNSSNSIRDLQSGRTGTNSTREPDLQGVGIYIQDYPRISVFNDSIYGYTQGLKIENTLPSLVSQPTLSNIRVRNSSNSIRNTGTGVYAGPGVKLNLKNSQIHDYGVGVSVYGNDAQITSNRFFNNDNALLMQATLPAFKFSGNELILSTDNPVQAASAIVASNVGAGTLNNNTIVNYPRLLSAEASNLTFTQNIGWAASALINPFQNTNSQVSVRYSDIRFSGGIYPGVGNINLDPFFADPLGYDHHLTYNSPCIDAGDPAWTYDEDETIADMGAFVYLHNADFTSDMRFVLPNTTIQFTNLSLGHPQQLSTFAWDFENDGVVDSNLENPTHTFVGLGRYHVKLVVTTGALRDTLLMMNYVLVQSSLLPAPQQVHLVVAENDTRLSWQPVTHDLAGNPITPNYYIVYANPKPFGQFRYVGQSQGAPEYTHLEGGVKNCMFYTVIAFTGNRVQLEHYLLSHESIMIAPAEDNTTPNERSGFGLSKP